MPPMSRFFRICLGAIALLLIIYLIAKDSFLFRPLDKVLNILIVPFMLAGFFYYLLRPIVRYLRRQRLPKTAAILIVYLAFAVVAALFVVVVWPTLQQQIDNFANGTPALVEGFNERFARLQHTRLASMLGFGGTEMIAKLSELLTDAVNTASSYISNVISAVTNFVIVVATAPIICYYMLKDGGAIPRAILHLVPKRYRKDGREVLEDIDSALSGFIVGRMIITFLLGVMMYIGFLIIGLPYSLLIALIATLLNIIPYIGPILGAIPCVIVAFIDSPAMVLWVLLVVVIAQQIESNLLSPHVYGRRLDIHPLTTILLLLVAADIAGILGVILAIPLYMVAKIVIVRLYRLFLAEKVEELVE
ncbi:AI-2E family transporter [Paenibacillus humicola]|uniref:AI-2E family transporter n=1 Tax=Paenibacillus humicola TaxID=3110540 RepID=UPI00237A362B|nr:AI-2E family transporter [Paenibacillus humicola]